MYTEWNNRWDVQLYKQVHANIKASRQRWHTDCKQINSEQCCRMNTNNEKRGHKQNKHVYVHIVTVFSLTPSFLQNIIDIYVV